MTLQKKLGGERLGSGNKMTVELHNFERSTHNLSHAWRSSLAPGVLVPFLNEIGLNGDTFDIDLATLVRTLPTINPLFGSFKMQMDVFQVPMRLYNGILHNNPIKIGMDMEKVYVPQMRFKTSNVPVNSQPDISQVSPTSLLHYLGYKGLGIWTKSASDQITSRTVNLNAMAILAYYDIFKTYYANKQENQAFVIVPTATATQVERDLKMTMTDQYTRDANGLFVSVNGRNYSEIDPSNETDRLGRKPNANGMIKTPTGWTSRDNNGMTDKIQKVNIKVKATNLYSLTMTIQTTDQNEDKHSTPITISQANDWKINIEDEVNYLKLSAQLVDGETETEKWLQIWTDTIETYQPQVFYQIIVQGLGKTMVDIPTDGSMVIDLNAMRDNVEIEEFTLSDIDDMRRYLLGRNTLGERTYINGVGGANIALYEKVLGTKANETINNMAFTMNGLVLKTYQSDMFTNWLDSEQIIGNSGINEITKIVPDENGSFTIDTFILANKIYNMLNRIAVSGGTYEDWQEAVYGEEAIRHAESPIYCGGASCEITFEEVVSQSATEDQALGSLAGKGTQTNIKGGHIQIHVKEPSIIIGIVSITPRVDYYQGNNWAMNLQNYDELHKPSLDQIGFQDLMGDTFAWFNGHENDGDVIEYDAYGKQPAWLHYMTAVNELHGDFCEENKAQTMVLARKFHANALDEINRKKEDREFGSNIVNFTSYINPSEYNYAFADSSLTAQNFWVQIGITEIVRRKMSAKVMPNL
ncbi:major capsid protein [Microvirus sp.]|nr:major capsid protein [Microvirus sp.]